MRLRDRSRLPSLRGFTMGLLVAGWAIAAPPARSEIWRSPLHDRTYVQIEKRLLDPLLDAEAASALPPSEVFERLPKEIEDLLGPDAVDYDSFAAAYLPAAEAAQLLDLALERGLLAASGIDRSLHLPWRTWEAGGAEPRVSAELPPALQGDRAVPGLFLVQFAYPLQEDWLAALEACGAQRIADLQERTVLVRTVGPRSLLSCPVSRYLSWIDAYRNGDRISEELGKDPEQSELLLQFVPGTDLGAKRSALGEGLRPAEGDSLEERMSMFGVQGKVQDLLPTLAGDPDLLSVSRRGEVVLSDERQGQIVAGNHNGTAPTGPGYRSWLAARGLLTASNPQIVGIIDDGYDNGAGPTPTLNHHPDLELPERLAAPVWSWGNGDRFDLTGHGTMVAGIIAGDGAVGFGTGGTDPQGYLYGSGIAPSAKLVVARPGTKLELQRLAPALDYCRVDPANGADRALVVNNSYNGQKLVGGLVLADNEYDEFSMFFDDKVQDASTVWSGQQATTIVFSAGNHAYDYATATIRKDSVASPATAKNVISVGATASYRPVPEPPLACFENPNGSRPPNQDALHIARLGLFSGRGKGFGSAPGPALVHNVRVKPDLVAPGVRVFSTVPYFFSSYRNPVGCSQFYPVPNVNYYTYGTGTSFAAPVVSGVAALKRKWFLDRGTDPSPSLLKASLIATADSLGAFVGNDHRPSSSSGWGRVNLNRATDARARFFVKDNQSLAVSTGQQRSWTRTIDSPGSDTYIVLVWSDPKADVIGGSQAALKNNLGLAVSQPGTTISWRGNNFRENRVGDDNGYSYRFTTLAETPYVDSINNVEAVFIPANTFTAEQKLTIKITGENVTAGAQKFAVYAYNLRFGQ